LTDLKSGLVLALDLSRDGRTGIWQPRLIVVRTDPDGKFSYFERECNEQTLKDFMGLADPEEIKALVDCCREIQIDELLRKFNRSKKKLSIENVLQDSTTGPQLTRWVEQKLAQILEAAKKNSIAAILEPQRKEILEAKKLIHSDFPAEARLLFKKTDTGLEYHLRLWWQDALHLVSKSDILLINDKPAWIAIKGQLVRLNGINANKLSPFLQKDFIAIPRKLTRQYFEKFVADLIAVCEVETEGYPIQKDRRILKASLIPVFDFLQEKWALDVVFEYDRFRVSYADLRDGRTFVQSVSEEEVAVSRVERDRGEEEQMIRLLSRLGLRTESNRRFYADGDGWMIFDFLVQHQSELTKVFGLPPVEIEGKKLVLEEARIETRIETGTDWFDLKGDIRLGPYTLPFSYIFKNLKSGKRECVLPDGNLFLIPREWFSRFELIARFGEEHGDGVRSSKAHQSRWEESEQMSGILLPKKIEQPQAGISLPQDLKASLRPYQVEGYLWLCEHYKNGLGACLADDMGLGKTLQTIAFLLYARDQARQLVGRTVQESGRPRDLFSEPEETFRTSSFCALIVMPSSLVFNWKAEFEKFAPELRVLQHIGQDRPTQPSLFEPYEVILTSYAILLRDYRLFSEKNFDCMILDESQQIKNRDSKTFRMLHQLKAKSRITLSGTPIENSLSDLWSQMEFINPKILGSYSFFNNHFLKPIQNLRDADALEELRQITGPYILRRSKQQVNPDLPELTEQVFYCDMLPEQRRLYEQEKAAARNSLLGLDPEDQKNRFVILRSLMRLRQLANHPSLIPDTDLYDSASGKMDDVCGQLDTLFKSRQKALIFSSFTEHLSIYESWFKKQGYGYTILTGDTALPLREQNVKRFQEDPDCLFFLISLKAGGTGLNLTAAEYVLILDPWWNPFAERQAVSRAHRIGQKNPVQLTRFISRDSIEEKILKLQHQKVTLSEELLVENQLPDWIGKNLEELLG